ncbi:TetR/AcrR family transcriptional regulator C-terminal domain-containing protein [Streptomyces gilvosporeus]|uniref:Tetracycline repressor protein class H n=1 Tax=Streptomyces gilvosporeus TaxID=553510 RepID=A0A1V0TVA1_9ACTN|nr:TetR/AcrR family transcriptional regulator C-terminal domain-containing protein [Streptomyces gilvosporeus]ARF56869.1 tetracycline repressor protein class H [Streptomyces gilvosporeus]
MADRAGKRSRGERAGLSRELVLDTALQLVDREGLRGLSMRRLGGALGVEAMTLYHYVPSKEALLDGLVERVFAEALPPSVEGAPWQEQLLGYAASLRETLLRHPGVLPLAVTRPMATPAGLDAVERGLGALTGAGFPLGRALDAFNALSLFVVGHTAAEVGVGSDADPEGRTPGSAGSLARLDAARYPLLTEAARTGTGADDAERFGFAAKALVTGFAAGVGAESGGAGRLR